MPQHPYLDSPASGVDGPIAFAHRGGNTSAPENTMAAFEHAVSLGYRHLETDVHRSKDGVLVAFHDADLLRTCAIDAKIGDLTWDEISELRVDGTEPIPKMSDLLERWPDHRFNIDCKSAEAIEPLIQLIREHDALDRVCLASFSQRRLHTLRKRLGPDLLSALGPLEIACLRVSGWLFGSRFRAAQVPARAGRIVVVNERFIRNAHRRGIPVHVWTINDAAEMRRLLDLGVDGIMTDELQLLGEVMAERGLFADPT
jgi:glycerophosphoryl diester phosphodiesterase